MSGGEDKKATNIEAEAKPILSQPDYKFDQKVKRYRNRATGQITSRADVEKAIANMADKYLKLRLPTWNADKPKLWFTMCENMFELAELGDGESDQKKKASLIQRELPESVATSVEEAIVNPTKATPYKCLKDAILAVHQQSPEEAWMEINNMTLGDQKPSTLGHAILASIPSRCSNDNSTGCEHKKWLVENIFKSKLPQTVRNGLVGVDLNIRTPTEFLAKADKLMASTKAKQMGVHEVSKAEEVDAVGTRGGRKASGNKQRATRPKDVCFNHFKYKKEAWKCNAPSTCKFAKQVTPKPEAAKKDQKE